MIEIDKTTKIIVVEIIKRIKIIRIDIMNTIRNIPERVRALFRVFWYKRTS